VSNVIKEFMDMKPGARFLENIGRIATALERIADYLGEVRDDHKRGIEAKFGLRKEQAPPPLPTLEEGDGK